MAKAQETRKKIKNLLAYIDFTYRSQDYHDGYIKGLEVGLVCINKGGDVFRVNKRLHLRKKNYAIEKLGKEMTIGVWDGMGAVMDYFKEENGETETT